MSKELVLDFDFYFRIRKLTEQEAADADCSADSLGLFWCFEMKGSPAKEELIWAEISEKEMEKSIQQMGLALDEFKAKRY